MKKYTLPEVENIVNDELATGLEWLLREGARKMLQSALEMEVSEYIEFCQDQLEQTVTSSNYYF